MQKFNNFNSIDDLWLECEKIQQSIALVIENLSKISKESGDEDYTELLAEIQTKLDEQTSSLRQIVQSSSSGASSTITQRIMVEANSLNSSLTSLINSKTTEVQSSLTSLSNVLDDLSDTANSTNQNTTTLLQNASSLLSAISQAQSTILQAIEDISSGGEDEPFILDFDEVYGTNSTYYSPQTFYSQEAVFTLLDEPFVIDHNAPAYILAEFDLSLDSGADVTISYNLNSTPVHTVNTTLSQGQTHIMHQFALSGLVSSDNAISITISTPNATVAVAKTIQNLKFIVVGNNALFLRENTLNMFACFPVSSQMYLTKTSKNVCEYKVLDALNLDFSASYTLLASLASESTIYPTLILNCSPTLATLNSLAYMQTNPITGNITTHLPDGAAQRTLSMVYSSNLPRYIALFPYYDPNGTYTAQFALIYPKITRFRRYRLYNIVRSSTLSQNFSNALVPVQAIFPTMCTIKNGTGEGSGFSDYVMYQTTHGDWYASTTTMLSQNKAGFLLGYGSQANFSLCPPPVQNANDNYLYMRAFIKSYSTWRAYYFYVNKTDGTFNLLKVQRITGNYDQILSGNANLCLGVKNGAVTPFYDENLKSITEF